MKKFKFTFTKTTKILIYAGLALAVAALITNTCFLCFENFAEAPSLTFLIIRYSVMYFASVLLIVVLASLLFSSYYAVDDKWLKTNFGIIKSKYDVEKIQTILLDRAKNKLYVYFSEENFILISVNPEWYEEFADALLAVNRTIEFSIKSKENEDKNDDKKA